MAGKPPPRRAAEDCSRWPPTTWLRHGRRSSKRSSFTRDRTWASRRPGHSSALGRLERRAQQKREARERLGQALEIFARLGASLWAERARSELRRIGGRRAA